MQKAYIKASNAEAYDQLGYSVAVSGDLLALGAWWEAATPPESTAARQTTPPERVAPSTSFVR
jgi:hypothetical protein